MSDGAGQSPGGVSLLKTFATWLVVIVVVIVVWNMINAGTSAPAIEELRFDQFLYQVKAGGITAVTINGQAVEGFYADGGEFTTVIPSNYSTLYDDLLAANVALEVRDSGGNSYVAAIISWAPMLLLIGVWIFFMRQMQGGGNRAIGFGKNTAKLFSGLQDRKTFKDVAGIEEAKEEVQEIIEFLKEPQKFQRLGGRIPKGVLLIGPPGNGKTLLARAVAGEADVPFFTIAGSDFVEMFVGVGASRVRDLFAQAKSNAPCIVFIDEIDAVGRRRGAGLGGGHDEREQTLNQLLVEMDGFSSNEGVILIAATNRPDVLDPALLRPGRFDRRIMVDRADVRGRNAILRIHTRAKPLAEDVDLATIARGTPGFSGADLENLVNEAALLAARLDHEKITPDDFEEAKDKVLMGVKRRSLILSDEEKRITAWHEAGHAVLAHVLHAKDPRSADPLHKVTIIPRGKALGVTMQLPLDDRRNYTLTYLLGRLKILYGGRIAEEMQFDGEMTSGAKNDFEQATDIARSMVTEWGMSEKVGPMVLSSGDQIFIGRELTQQRHDHGIETTNLVDSEIKELLVSSKKEAEALLQIHRVQLDLVAETLLIHETLDGDQIASLIETGELPLLEEEIATVVSGEDVQVVGSSDGPIVDLLAFEHDEEIKENEE